jgi:hypothetical protein
LNHNIYLADWSYPVARYYFRNILFYGMWPLAGWDGSKGLWHGISNASIKWLYFCWFAKVSAELYLRGVLQRPLLRVDWAEYAGTTAPISPIDSTLTRAFT